MLIIVQLFNPCQVEFIRAGADAEAVAPKL